MAEDKPLEYYYDLIIESEKLIAECKLTKEREILNKTNICLLEYKIITAKALIKKKIALRMLRAKLSRSKDD
tara:strand:+ start:1247 stop:1462 length:216 start_codon:yes stop_codon:yes gene_type:complete